MVDLVERPTTFLLLVSARSLLLDPLEARLGVDHTAQLLHQVSLSFPQPLVELGIVRRIGQRRSP